MSLTGATKHRGILTLAFGQPRYLEMAKALARSLVIHEPDVPRAVVTDASDPELRSLFTHCVDHCPEYGSDVRQKMFLDKYSPFEETLFVDSDCLVVGSIEPFWQTFAGYAFGVPGTRVLQDGDTDPYMDLPYLLEHFKLKRIGKFNGGTYYFTKSAASAEFFATVRNLLEQAVELRYRMFRKDAPADEAIYATAMALHGLEARSMGTAGMFTPINADSSVQIDVLRGWCSFRKEGVLVKPVVAHFAGDWGDSPVYLRECLKLRRVAERSFASPASVQLSTKDLAGIQLDALTRRASRYYAKAARRTQRLLRAG